MHFPWDLFFPMPSTCRRHAATILDLKGFKITVSAKPAPFAISNSELVMLVARRIILGSLNACPFCFESSCQTLETPSSPEIHESFSTRIISGWILPLPLKKRGYTDHKVACNFRISAKCKCRSSANDLFILATSRVIFY